MDRPCAKCGKGLYSADDCLRGFSSQFRGKDELAAANVAQEEDGDLNTEQANQPKADVSPKATKGLTSQGKSKVTQQKSESLRQNEEDAETDNEDETLSLFHE